MLRFIGAAAVIALAAGSPVLAQGKSKDNGAGGPGSGDHAAMDHGSDHSSGQDDSAKHGQKGSEIGRGIATNGKTEMRIPLPAKGEGGRDRLQRARDNDERARVIERAVVRDHGDDPDYGEHGQEGRGRSAAIVPACPPGLASKEDGCLPPGLAKQNRDRYFGYKYSPALFGVPLRAQADYVYYNGYLVPANGSTGLSYVPLLGGALAVGRIWPQTYPTDELAEWQRDYFGFDDPGDYRYADNVVYRVDPATSAIESVVALLTGDEFAVGQRLPLGYDVYNVPGAYRDRYVDSDEALYRYADGRVYQIDPTSMLIQKAIELVL